MMGTKNWRQCKERWNQFLNPNINKDSWTEEEDDLLIRLHEKYGSKWSLMVSHFKGRPRLQIRNRYNLLMKKQKWKQEIGSPFIVDDTVMDQTMDPPIPEPIMDEPFMDPPIPEPIMDQVPITDLEQDCIYISDNSPIDESNLVQKEDETDELYKEYDNFNEFVYDWKLEESTEKTNNN